MESWEDCVASLQAGASPEELLPRIRALFSRLPPPGAAPAAKEHLAARTPVDGLYYTMEDGKEFQMPYLRAPFFLWGAVKRAAGEGAGEEVRVDTEFDVDLMEEFGPRFIDPPSEELKKLLGEQHLAAAVGDGDGEQDVDWHRIVSPMETSEESVQKPKQQRFTADGINRVTRDLALFLGSSKALEEDDDGPVCDSFSFPPLSLQEWSLAFSGLDTCFLVSANRLSKLLLAINQPSLARLVLQSIFPFLLAGDPGPTESEHLMSLLSFSASIAQLEKLPTAQVRALLDVYRGTSGGVLSALAQLSIVTHSKRPC